MKKYLIYLMMAAAVMTFAACSPEDGNEPETPGIETPDTPDNPDDPNNPNADNIGMWSQEIGIVE